MATTMPISSISSSEYLKMPCCHTYRLQPCNGSHTVTPGGVPKYEHSCNVPRLPNSSANYWRGQSIWTHPYWPQPAHSHRPHSPTWAQLKGSPCSSAIPSSTRGMPFRAQLVECHVLNPYPELNSRDAFRAQLKEH